MLVDLLLVFALMLVPASSQTIFYNDTINKFYFYRIASYTPTNATDSPFYPNNYLRPSSLGNSSLYLLDSDNVVKVYNRSNPKIYYYSDTSFKYSLFGAHAIAMNVYANDSMLVLTVHNATGMMHYIR